MAGNQGRAASQAAGSLGRLLSSWIKGGCEPHHPIAPSLTLPFKCKYKGAERHTEGPGRKKGHELFISSSGLGAHRASSFRPERQPMRKASYSLVELLHMNGWRIHFKAALRTGLLKKKQSDLFQEGHWK